MEPAPLVILVHSAWRAFLSHPGEVKAITQETLAAAVARAGA